MSINLDKYSEERGIDHRSNTALCKTINIINLGAACCIIEAGGQRILCDPWFTDGIYAGTWEREDYIADPIARIGRVDCVWISHLHEDHYDKAFLHAYFAAYPKATLWIGGTLPDYLYRIIVRDGFNPIVQNHLHLSHDTDAFVVSNNGYDFTNIDTALVVRTPSDAVVNLNDNPYDEKQIERIKHLIDQRFTIGLIPYTGAGPWPQCFEMPDADKQREADKKAKRFSKVFQAYADALLIDIAIPFSAGYRLRGRLSAWNGLRGIPSPEEIPGATILPVETDERTSVWDGLYEWEQDPKPGLGELRPLLEKAAEKAPKVGKDPLIIAIDYQEWLFMVNIGSTPVPLQIDDANDIIRVDPRLLHGLLTRKYHWNTVEIGSCLNFYRPPWASYSPRVVEYLARFHL